MNICTLVSVIFIFFGLIAVRRVRAVACDEDEECKPISECKLEYGYFLNRDYSKLKVCGIVFRTDKHCCKKDIETTTINIRSALPLPFSDHPNINLINHRNCGKSFRSRIVGGSKANIGDYPWTALLMYRSTDGEDKTEFLCGGSLISSKYVLTAAHCLRAQLFSVRLGEHTISTKRDCDFPDDDTSCSTDPLQDIEIEKAISHESFDKYKKTNDLALLRLKKEAIFKRVRNVETICLPVVHTQNFENLIQDNDKNLLTVAGWGLKEDKKRSDVLLYARVPYVRPDQCAEKYQQFSKVSIQDTHLCAGGYNNTDSCGGDSGSPIISPALLSDTKIRMFQQGLVSFGTEGCSITDPFPGVYTRISKFMKWILDNLAE